MWTDAARPRSLRSASSLKSVRYETDTQPGIPPRRVASAAILARDSPLTPPATSRTAHSSSKASSIHSPSCPPTAPAPHPRRPVAGAVVVDVEKRDSGIAPSVSTTDGASSSFSPPTVARQPDLPTIIVQDEDSVVLTHARSTSPAAQSRKERPRGISKSTSPPPSPPPAALPRKMSLKGKQTSDPSTFAAGDINLDDLTSDKITFSTRGSLLFGGKRMQELIAAQGGEAERSPADEVTCPAPAEKFIAEPEEVTQREETHLNEAAPTAAVPNPVTHHHGKPKKGLIAGKRTPSLQMLQAAQGGRVLSAEEATYSTRVRSMYDHGDERAANWVGPLHGVVSRQTTPTQSGRDNVATPDSLDGDLTANGNGQPTSRSSSISADPRSSLYHKEANEIAGGIEDWEDIDSRHVDRYGFIHLDRPASRLSESSPRGTGVGMRRVATSLRVEAEQSRRDRKLNRGPASIRSSRSLPPGSVNGTIRKGPASLRSMQSYASGRTNPFRSRTRKVLDEAADMLTPPPGLTDITEDEDAGSTASALKQREWAREEKWQKMAQPVVYGKSAGKGGGMRFTFDTAHPKLIERTWKGIPDRWRATAWHSFLSASAKKRNSLNTDEELKRQFHQLQGINSADDVQIDVDVPRTINMHVMFRKRYRGGQRLLFRVLHAVSLYFPETGYVQGMAALAVTLLCYYDEEVAFVMMVRLWQLRGLDKLYQAGFEGLMTCLKEFEAEWLRRGDVAVKLRELGIDPTAWGTRWYLTLFNMSVPFEAQLRIWDVFMLLGDASSANSGAFGGADLDVLHATSGALIDATREILLDSDFENAMKVLTSFMPIKDEDLLMRVAKAEWKMKKKRDGVRV